MNCLKHLLLALGTALQLYPLIALTQDYPSRPVRIVVPYPPGGGVDRAARPLAERLSRAWGVAVIVDNKPGGGTAIGAEAVARATPDGYTLLYADNSTVTSNPYVYAKLPYDPVRDLAPVTNLFMAPQIFVVHPSVAANTLQELAVLARLKPGELNYGSFGIGTPPHLAFESFKTQSGAHLTHIPYKGFAQVIQALIAGEIQLAMSGTAILRGYIQAGKVKPLAIARAEREPTMPNVPTLREAGFPNIDPAAWIGLFATGGTPRPIIAKIQADVAAIFGDREFRERHVLQGGFDPAICSPEEFATLIRSDLVYKAQLFKNAGIRAE